MAYAGRHNIYEGTIRKMVTKALEAQEEEFQKEHGMAPEEQLLSYLRRCAAQLHHTPWPGEILGGTVIEARFGSWESALARAQLPPPKTDPNPASFLRVKQEEAHQKEVYRQRKAEKKIQAQKRRAQQAAREKAVKEKQQ